MKLSKEKSLCYFLIIGSGMLAAHFPYQKEKAYFNLDNTPIEIQFGDIEKMNASIDKYVHILDCCHFEAYVANEKNGRVEKEVYALKDCSDMVSDSSCIFASAEKGIYYESVLDLTAPEEGEVSMYEGQLLKAHDLDRGNRKLFAEMGIWFPDDNLFELISGKTPQNTSFESYLRGSLTLLISFLICLALKFYFKKKEDRIEARIREQEIQYQNNRLVR